MELCTSQPSYRLMYQGPSVHPVPYSPLNNPSVMPQVGSGSDNRVPDPCFTVKTS
jgi:hypothetical protein